MNACRAMPTWAKQGPVMEYSVYGMVEHIESTEGSVTKRPRKHPHHCQHKWTHKVYHLSVYSFSDSHSEQLLGSDNGTKPCNCANISPRKQLDHTNSSASVCPNDWLQKKGKCYKFFMNFESWIDSQKSCLLKKSHLLMIQDKAELDFIQSNIQDGIYFWIGLNVTYPPKAWTWLDGTPLDLQLFQVTGQVDEQTCAVITKKGVFSEKCFVQSYWICQEVISPTEINL
ncbi:killer cell lectin-like receptor subfamily F member 2 [Ochotona curzoniae]|uniref:killer cell lectin-like receptor subfamily F member 2 n=1 Tax=Ochotona curzoniae TaxID=130825 RepID=UPI001B34ED84|nr:killer cell lectin-like receptor subfamily F member 2 [Ochotona curzoniae]